MGKGNSPRSARTRSSTNLGTLGAITDYIIYINTGGVVTRSTAEGKTCRYLLKHITSTDQTVLTTAGPTVDGTTLVIPHTASAEVVSDGANWRIALGATT